MVYENHLYIGLLTNRQLCLTPHSGTGYYDLVLDDMILMPRRRDIPHDYYIDQLIMTS